VAATFSRENKHDDLILSQDGKVVTNPDGQWRSVQTSKPLTADKSYVVFKVHFKPGKFKFKYFGLAP